VGVLLAHATRSSDVIAIVTSSVGWVGVLVTIVGTLKINDWNLYSSGLGVVNFFGAILNRRVNRAVTTAVIGVVGSLLAAGGILDHFIGFLSILGVTFPPIAGIFVAEYFVVRRWRPELDRSRSGTEVPAESPQWVPVTLVIWLVAALVGYYVSWGLPSINSLVVAFVLYAVAGKAGWVRGYGRGETETFAEARAAAPVAVPTTTGV
jgi:cytosine permease